MAFLENLQFHPCGGDDDPDDYRPRSSWAVAVDPPVVLPGSGHEPQCRIPEQVNRILDEFLAGRYPAN